MCDGPFHAILEVCQHVLQRFGPFGVAVELQPDGHIGHFVLIYCVRHLKGVVLGQNPVCKFLQGQQ